MATVIHRNCTLHDVRAVDGDTVQCWLEFYRHVRVRVRIRLPGIEGGELNTSEGERAKLLLQRFLDDRKAIIPWLTTDPGTTDQHGRIVSDIAWHTGETLVALCLRTGYWWRRKRDGTQDRPKRDASSETKNGPIEKP